MPSRRELIALSEDEIQQFLEQQKTLIIVSNGRDGYPHPMPMWFYTDPQGCIYCTTFAKAQKVLNWRRDPDYEMRMTAKLIEIEQIKKETEQLRRENKILRLLLNLL